MRLRYFVVLLVMLMMSIAVDAQDIPEINPHWVKAVEWSPTGSQIAFATLGGNLKILDAKTGEVILALESENVSFIYALAWNPDGTQLAVAKGGATEILDPSDGQVLMSLRGHIQYALSLTWNPNGLQLATSSVDDGVRIWDVITGEIIFSHRVSEPYSVAWSPDGTTLAISKFGKIRLWSVTNQQFISSIDTPEGVFTMAWSPDGKQIASSETYTAESSAVRIWDVSTGQLVKTFEHHTDTIMSVNWSPQGNILATASRDGTLRVWNITSGNQVGIYQSDDIIFDASFSPFGGRLAFGITLANQASEINTQDVVQTFADGAIHIIVPAPSLDLLQSIQAACVPTKPPVALPTTDDLAIYIEALKADASLPPACAADLIAVAEALQAQQNTP